MELLAGFRALRSTATLATSASAQARGAMGSLRIGAMALLLGGVAGCGSEQAAGGATAGAGGSAGLGGQAASGGAGGNAGSGGVDSGLGDAAPPQDAAAAQDAGLVALAHEDFEVDLGAVINPFGTPNRYARVAHEPRSGEQCLRLNLKQTTDPLTGLDGHGLYTPDWRPAVDAASRPAMTWVLWFRYDDVDYHVDGDTAALRAGGKFAYLLGPDSGDLGNTFFISGFGGSDGLLTFTDNGGSSVVGWEERSYGWRRSNGAPRTVLYLHTGMPFGADGVWHRLRLEIDYENASAGHSRARITVDGAIARDLTDGNTDAEGWFTMPPEMVVEAWRLGYLGSAAADGATARSGHPCGLQLDDLAVYEGIE